MASTEGWTWRQHIQARHFQVQVFSMLAATWGGFLSTFIMTYTSSALPSMNADPNFNITDEQASWVGSVMPISAFLGSLAGGPLVDMTGRKMGLLLIGIPFILGWILVAIAPSVFEVLMGRAVSGAAVGLFSVSFSVYWTEVVEVSYRFLGIASGIMGGLGLMVGMAAGTFLAWRQTAWMGAILSIPYIVAMLAISDSPFYLIKQGKTKESLEILKRIRRTEREANEELDKLKRSISSSADKSEGISAVFQSPNSFAVLISILLMFFQQTTGINVVLFYAGTILEASGTSLDPDVSSALIGVMNLVLSFMTMPIVLYYNRKTVLLLSTLLTIPTLFLLSAYFYAKYLIDINNPTSWALALSQWGSLPVVSLIIYMGGFGIGWGPVPWMFLSEGLPSPVRGIGASISGSSNWLCAFLVTKLYDFGVSALGVHGVFLVFALLTLLGQLLMSYFMLETKDLTMEQVDQLYARQAAKKKLE